MKIKLTVYAQSLTTEKNWIKQLETVLSEESAIEIQGGHSSKNWGDIVFLDSGLKNLAETLSKIDRQGRGIFLVVKNQKQLPQFWIEGKVDDVIVLPFRTLDVFSKIRAYEQILTWNEVVDINDSISEVLQKFQEDLRLAERLQKAKIASRSSDLKGIRVSNRYFAGLKSGGDHFDFAESKDKSLVSLFLSHSTSYGLSSAVLSALMRVTLKVSVEALGKAGSATEVVQKIYDELLLTLGEKDRISLFFGTFSRADHYLRYFHVGQACAFYAKEVEKFQILKNQGPALSQSQAVSLGQEKEIQLHPMGRLVLVSYGFIESLGGEEKVCSILNEFRNRDATDVLNELSFKMKSKLAGEDEMPAQDCSTVVFDVEPQVLKLTKRGLAES
jgi:hypothetical protein